MREKLCPPSPGTVRGGKQQILRRERGGGRRDLGGFPLSGGILHPSPLFPRCPRRKKKKKSPPDPRGLPGRARHPSGLQLLRAPGSLSLPFPSPREAAPARPGPSPPLRPLPRPRVGKHKGGGTGAVPGGARRAAPRGPRSPTIVPSQVPRSRLQLGFARRSPDVIRKSNEIVFSNSKN